MIKNIDYQSLFDLIYMVWINSMVLHWIQAKMGWQKLLWQPKSQTFLFCPSGGPNSLQTDSQILWHLIRVCVNFFFKLNLLPPYLLCSQGITINKKACSNQETSINQSCFSGGGYIRPNPEDWINKTPRTEFLWPEDWIRRTKKWSSVISTWYITTY